MAVALAKGKRYAPRAVRGGSEAEIAAIVERETQAASSPSPALPARLLHRRHARRRGSGFVRASRDRRRPFQQPDRPGLRADGSQAARRPHGGRSRRRHVHRRPAASDDRPERARRADDGRARRRARSRSSWSTSSSATDRTRTRPARSPPAVEAMRAAARPARRLSAGPRFDHRHRRRPAELRAARRRSSRPRAASSCPRTTRPARWRPRFSSESARAERRRAMTEPSCVGLPSRRCSRAGSRSSTSASPPSPTTSAAVGAEVVQVRLAAARGRRRVAARRSRPHRQRRGPTSRRPTEGRRHRCSPPSRR